MAPVSQICVPQASRNVLSQSVYFASPGFALSHLPLYSLALVTTVRDQSVLVVGGILAVERPDSTAVASEQGLHQLTSPTNNAQTRPS
ncbi:unnamed protein product [Protopolystoma xenopodis]|uniref:Uncharacterized protein n=1 Tax=Protopolystoma xenopodis TaxID=117903 RepID=A0A3S5B8D3_9PLAT|nr:unnamed protein product [Protopolystoma xenopodis]